MCFVIEITIKISHNSNLSPSSSYLPDIFKLENVYLPPPDLLSCAYFRRELLATAQVKMAVTEQQPCFGSVQYGFSSGKPACAPNQMEKREW